MHIDSATTIAGIPLVRVRDFLRKQGDWAWDEDELAEDLDLTPDAAGVLFAELQAQALIEPHPENPGWWTTITGQALANASLRRYRRATAKALERLVERAAEVNASDRFLHRVTRIRLFGSMLDPSRDQVSDVDVVIEMEPKEADPEIHWVRCQDHSRNASDAGRHFATYLDYLVWPETEVLLFLRNRSPILSFISPDDRILQQTTTKVIFEASEGVA